MENLNKFDSIVSGSLKENYRNSPVPAKSPKLPKWLSREGEDILLVKQVYSPIHLTWKCGTF